MSFLDEVRALYDAAAEAGTIASYPFVGSAFAEANDKLRIACVGINSYISPKDWPPGQRWFSSWFEQQQQRFSKGAAKAATTIGRALELAGWGQFDGLNSMWATNAIKVHLREAEGKQAHQVPREDYQKHAITWRREIDLMAAHGVLPHAVVVLGDPQWPATCQSLDPKQGWSYEHLRLLEYQTTRGVLFHNLNRIRIEARGAEHALLIVRVPHPRAFGAKPRADDLIVHPDFQRVVALGTRG